MRTATITIISAAALAAVPALAAADPGHGQSGAHAHGLGRCDHPQRVAFVARGSLVSFDAGTGNVVLNVVRANHHARAFTSGQPLSTTGAGCNTCRRTMSGRTRSKGEGFFTTWARIATGAATGLPTGTCTLSLLLVAPLYTSIRNVTVGDSGQ